MKEGFKHCPKCGEDKPTGEFYKCKVGESGLTAYCKTCIRKLSDVWRKKNPEKFKELSEQWKLKHPDYFVENGRKWRLKNLGRSRGNAKRWRLANPEKHRAINTCWRKKHPDQVKEIQKNAYIKKVSTPRGKLDHRMGSAIWHSLYGNKNGRCWEALVGYTAEDLKKHLESLFTVGMTWENMGKWHIDHSVPKSRFHYETAESPEFKVCWSLANLQPMWKLDNLSKHAKTMDEWKGCK